MLIQVKKERTLNVRNLSYLLRTSIQYFLFVLEKMRFSYFVDILCFFSFSTKLDAPSSQPNKEQANDTAWAPQIMVKIHDNFDNNKNPAVPV